MGQPFSTFADTVNEYWTYYLGDGYASQGKPQGKPNSYMTWSVAFYALYKAKKEGYAAYNRIKDLPVAISASGNELTIDDILSVIIDVCGHDLAPSDFKKFDLGGRDQNTLRDEINTGISAGNVSEESKLSSSKISGRPFLLTGGDVETRLKNLKYFQMYVDGSQFMFALLPQMETMLTGLSIMNYLECQTGSYPIGTLMVPIGSTDAHLIYVSEMGIKASCITNYNKSSISWEEELKYLIGNEDIKQIICGGSFLFGLDPAKVSLESISPEDINDEGQFKSVSKKTGAHLMKLCEAELDFSCITNSGKKGSEISKFLTYLLTNEFMRSKLASKPDILSFPRVTVKDLTDGDVNAVLRGL